MRQPDAAEYCRVNAHSILQKVRECISIKHSQTLEFRLQSALDCVTMTFASRNDVIGGFAPPLPPGNATRKAEIL